MYVHVFFGSQKCTVNHASKIKSLPLIRTVCTFVLCSPLYCWVRSCDLWEVTLYQLGLNSGRLKYSNPPEVLKSWTTAKPDSRIEVQLPTETYVYM